MLLYAYDAVTTGMLMRDFVPSRELDNTTGKMFEEN